MELPWPALPETNVAQLVEQYFDICAGLNTATGFSNCTNCYFITCTEYTKNLLIANSSCILITQGVVRYMMMIQMELQQPFQCIQHHKDV